ncbi:MAG: sensor histidine kinase [Halanaerobiales bacterium]
MKRDIINILKGSSGIIGIGIAIIFFFTFLGTMFEPTDSYVPIIITLLIYIIFGYTVGVLIPIVEYLFWWFLRLVFTQIKINLAVSLMITFIIGAGVFYICIYFFVLAIGLFFPIHIEYIVHISLGVGVASVMIHLFWNYFEQVNEKVKLEKENRKLAVIEERNRIARELHDSVSQNLFGISLNLNTLPAIIETDNQKAVDIVEQLQEMVQEVQTEMRLMIYELRPLNLKDKDFYESIESLISLFRKRYKIDIVYNYSGEEVNLDEKKQLVLYRVLQESLNNIVKHAKASKVKVFIKIEDNNARLVVEDDGRGFDISKKNSGEQYGIKSMRERLEETGGALKLISDVGEGTKVVARV